jgi:hypothetical protein
LNDATGEDHRRVIAVALGDAEVRLAVARQPGRIVEHERGPGVGYVMLDHTRLEQRVHRHDDAAGPQDAVLRHRELRDVREHDADPVPGS